MYKMVAKGAGRVKDHGDDESGAETREGRVHGRPLFRRLAVVHQPAVSGQFRPLFPQGVRKGTQDDRDDVAQHCRRCDPRQDIPRVQPQCLGVHGGKRHRTRCHPSTGHGDRDIEDPLRKLHSSCHPQESHHQHAGGDRDQRGRKDLHRGPDQKIAVDVEEAAGDQRRNIEHQEILLVDEAVQKLKRVLRDHSHRCQDRAAQNTDDRSAEERLHHRHRLPHPVQTLAQHQKDQEAADHPPRDAVGIHSSKREDQHPQIEGQRYSGNIVFVHRPETSFRVILSVPKKLSEKGIRIL